MMNRFLFGPGKGRLTKIQMSLRRSIADTHGATFVVIAGNQGHCTCGRGCQIGTCPEKLYWYLAPQKGEPFDSQLARRILDEVSKREVPCNANSSSI